MVNSTAIRDALAALLTTAGAKNVYTEDPKLINWDETVDMLRQQDGQYVQCWILRRVGSLPIVGTGRTPGCMVLWNHTFNVMMFFGYVENSSEDQMQDLIDTVLTAMQDERTMTNTAFGALAPLALQSIQPRELGGIGGYEAIFTITIQEHETGITPR